MTLWVSVLYVVEERRCCRGVVQLVVTYVRGESQFLSYVLRGLKQQTKRSLEHGPTCAHTHTHKHTYTRYPIYRQEGRYRRQRKEHRQNSNLASSFANRSELLMLVSSERSSTMRYRVLNQLSVYSSTKPVIYTWAYWCCPRLWRC